MILATKTFNLKHSTGKIEWDYQTDREYLEWEEACAKMNAPKTENSLD